MGTLLLMVVAEAAVSPFDSYEEFSISLRQVGCNMKTHSLLSACTVIVITALGCEHPDYEIVMPNGYSVLRTNASTTLLVTSRETTIAAKIKKIQYIEPLIIGEVVSSPRSEFADRETPGFFIVNTVTKSVKRSLSSAEFEQQLVALGVSTDQIELLSPWDLPFPRR